MDDSTREKLKEMKDLAKAMYLPMSSEDQERYVRLIEERVNIYQPKIEQRTGVDLGKVYVLPNKICLYLKLFEEYCKLTNPDLGDLKQGKTPSKLEKILFRATAPIIAVPALALVGLVLAPFLIYQNEAIDMAAGGDSIRVPTGYESRMNLWRLDNKKVEMGRLDETVIHELSHILWGKISNEKEMRKESLPLTWEEGFTTYAQQDFFKEFYPESYSISPNFGKKGIYSRGKQKVLKAIEKHGEEIFLQIPNKWRELEAEQNG